MKISEIITDKYKLRIPPNVYYDLLADVREAEEEQEPICPSAGVDCEDCPAYEKKTGHWIRVDKDKLRCSECEVIHLIAQYPNGEINWCPNCGAKMVEGEEKPKSEWQHDHEILKAYSDGANDVLDMIRAEIVELWKNEPCPIEYGCLDEILQIIDKYKAEGSDKE